MKKMFRRVLSFLLAVAIAGSVCPTGVFAADAGQPAQGGCSHVCGEACVRRELVCTLSEGDGHTHTEACYALVNECAHVHDETCGVSQPQPTAEPEPTVEPEPPAVPEPTAEPEPGPTAEPEPTAEPQGDVMEDMAEDAAPSDPDPALLDLETLVEEQGFAAFRSVMTLTSGLSGSTILVGEDNEDNAYSGKPDGDMDTLIRNRNTQHPIEMRVDVQEDQLPQESAVLAIKAYDVDEESGEIDTVYWNGVEIGRLSGTDSSWNTTILTVPKNLIKSGANYLEITVNDGWVVKIDWVQLLLDGGQKSEEVSSFSLKLGQPSQRGSSMLFLPVTVELQAPAGRRYETEFSLLDEAGNAVASAFGTATSSEQTTVQMTIGTKDMRSGNYRVVGLLKEAGTEQILAQDEVTWYYDKADPISLKPSLKISAAPSDQVARQAQVTITAVPMEGMTIQNITAPEIEGEPSSSTGSISFTVEQNIATTSVEVTYIWNGTQQTATIPAWVNVDNIDLVPPSITLEAQTMRVDAEKTDDQVRQQVLDQATITDQLSAGGNELYAGVASVECELDTRNIAATGGTITVTATDYAGNTAQATVNIEPIAPPLQLEQPVATRQGETNTFSLSAALISTGGGTASETGFVWGTMQTPTRSLNNGSSASSPAAQAGESITATATVVDGVNYYARAYVVVDGVTYYSPQTSFSIGAKSYGTISIQNNGDNTFTMHREGGTDGAQRVYYRTVNGSAVGGTHFVHKSSSVLLRDGQASATITIEENDVNSIFYSGATAYPATAYSNASRTYQVEIFKVEGGAVIGDENFATRTMTGNQTVERTLFEEYDVNGTTEQTTRGDMQEDGLGWGENDIGTAAIETANVRQDGIGYWQYTAQSLLYSISFDACEVESGYQAIQILAGNTLDTRVYPYEGSLRGTIDNTDVQYAALFEHGKDKKNTSYLSYCFPCASGNFPSDSTLKATLYHSGQSGNTIAFPVTTAQITTGFGASGEGSDKWKTQNIVHHIQIYDAQEPQPLGVAPMATATYKPGDRVTVSLVFDEIVDSQNSSLDNVRLETTWGAFAYAGGGDTNVLYFTGIVPDDASGYLNVQGISGAGLIKDMCDPTGTATSDSVEDSTYRGADTTAPSVSITDSQVSDGTASARVTVTNATTMEYVWTQSTTLPVSGWQSFASGDILSTRQQPGTTWYLHVLAQYSDTGASTHTYETFTFPDDPAAAPPDLTVSVDNTGWASERIIRLEYAPSTARVVMTSPDGATRDVTGDVTVTENGRYAFTLTSGEETLVQTVEVKNIDVQAPVAEDLRLPAQTGTVDSLSFSAVFSDDVSGLNAVEYCFGGSATPPADGWTTAQAENGRWFFEYTARSDQPETVYLHLRATDNAGNVYAYTSGAYIVQAPAAGELTVTLSASTQDLTSGDVTLTWKLGGAMTAPFTVYGVGSSGAQATSATMGSFNATRNGLYTVVVTDSRGRTGQGSILVNNIDVTPPLVTAVEVEAGWTNGSKSVTLVGLTDDLSPQYDDTGKVTGYSGSGIAAAQYKRSGAEDGTLTAITGDSFTVSENGSYTLVLTDVLGNRSTRLFTVAGIDTAPPAASLSAIPAGWQDAPVDITLTFSDADSGVQSVQTALVTDRVAPGAGELTSHPTAGGSVTVTAGQGGHYLYYKVTDAAGNATDGFSGLVQVDTVAPSLTVSQAGQQSRATLTVAVSGGESGAAAWWAAEGGQYQQLASGTLTLDAPGVYRFKAVSGAGVESAVQTVTLYQVDFDLPAGVDGLASQLILAGGRVEAPAADPARTGYAFAGWQAGGAAYDFGASVSTSLTLTAAWTLDPPAVDITAAYNGQSSGQFTYNGGDLVFTAAPSHGAGGIRYTYQWRDADGNDIPGATGATYAVTAASAGTHQYSCVVTATDADGLSAAATQTASAAIEKQPVPVPGADDTVFVYTGGSQTYSIAPDSRYTVRGDRQTNAGSYIVTVALNDTANYQWADGGAADRAYTFAIQKAAVHFAVSDAEHDYDAGEQAATVTPGTEVPGLTVSAADYAVHYEQNGVTVAPKDVGSYDVVVSLNNANLKFTGEEDTVRRKAVGSLTINGVSYPGADTMVWPDAAPLTYGQALAESVFSGEGLDTAGSYAWKTPDLIPTVDNGGCVVVFTPNDANYPAVEHVIPVEVAPKTLTIAGVTAQSRAYDPASTAVALSGGSLEGVVSREGVPDEVTLAADAAAGSVESPDAGQAKPVAVSGYALAGADAGNYALAQPDYVTVDIDPAAGEATLTMESWTYGDTPASPAAACATNGVDHITWRYTGTLADGSAYDSDQRPTDAGEYQVEAVFAATGNYLAVEKQAAFAIEKRGISATWNGLDLVYSATAQAPEIAGLIGVLPEDAAEVAASALASAGTDAGSYSAQALLTGGRAHNYSLQNDTARFTIRPAPVSFQLEGGAVLYDGQAHAAQVTAQALGQPFTAFELCYRAADGEEVTAPAKAGRYQVLATITDPNYRHSGGADGSARAIGVLEIYKDTAPALYSVTFLPGAQGVTGTLPTLPQGIAGTILTLPGAQTLSLPGYQFAGWSCGGKTYGAGATFVTPDRDVTFTALWEQASGEIIGSVEVPEGDDLLPVENMVITLIRGSEQIAQTRTGADGSFAFDQVAPGLYDLVAVYGTIVQTRLVELRGPGQSECVIRLPAGNTNSVLTVQDGAPAVVVGNLDRIFTSRPDEVYTEEDRALVESGGTVEVHMMVARTLPAADSPLTSAIQALPGGVWQGITLDVTLDKRRQTADGAGLGVQPISEANLLVEIVVPLEGELQNCQSYRVLRQHEGAVDELKTTANQWGEYYCLNEDRTALTIFARQFSLYSILSSNASADEGGTPQPTPQPTPLPALTQDTAAGAQAEADDQTGPAPTPAPTPAPEATAEPAPAGAQTEPGDESPREADASAGGRPFVLFSAIAALAGLLLVLLGTSRGKARLAAAACAAAALVLALVTTGWSGLALADLWTAPIALLAAAAGCLARWPRRQAEDTPQ